MATKFVAWEVPTLEALKGSKVYNLRETEPRRTDEPRGKGLAHRKGEQQHLLQERSPPARLEV